MKKTKNKRSIARHLRYGIMLFGILCVLVTGSVLIYIGYNRGLKDLERHMDTRARAAALEIDSYIDDLLRKLNYLARVRGLTDFSKENQQNLLQALVRHNKAYELVVIVNNLGEVDSYASEFGFKPEDTLVDYALYYKTYQQKENYIGTVTIDPNIRLPVLDIGVPIRNRQDRVKGILWARINLRFLWYVLSDIDIGDSGYAYILDQRKVMVAKKGDMIRKLEPASGFEDESHAPGPHGHAAAFHSRLYEGRVFGASAAIGSVNWQVVLELPRDEAHAPLFRMIRAMMAVMVGMVIIGGLVSLWMSGYFIKPLKLLTEAAEKIASGQPGVRVKVPAGYELGVLADTFNRMTRELEDGMASLKNEAAQREKAQYALEREATINAAMAKLSNSLISMDAIENISEEVLKCALRLTRGSFGFAGYSKKHAGSLICTTVIGDFDRSQLTKQDATNEFIRLWDRIQALRTPLAKTASQGDENSQGSLFNRFIVAPSMVGADLMGQIAVANAPRDYSPEDMNIIEQLADLFAIAIQRNMAEEKMNTLNEELELRVRERTAELEAANRELASFSYSVSHDLRSPLRAIDGFSQALLEDYQDKLDEDARDFLLRVRNATQHMGQMVDDILRLLGVTRHEMHREAVNLSTLMREIFEDFRKKEPQRQVELIIEENLVVNGDKPLLARLLNNLAQNAWKFTAGKEKAQIEFGRAREDKKAVFFIRDNGVGFDMAYVNKLFKAFNRLHSSEQYDGTGIGLALIERIVKRHGGKVWAYGKVGDGAVFYFSLGN